MSAQKTVSPAAPLPAAAGPGSVPGRSQGTRPIKHSAPNTAGAKAAAPDKKAWKDEIHTPVAEYNANLPVADIVPDPQNRKDHDPAALKGLADQIAAEGLIQPIAVRPHKNGTYMIIAGERRYLAHKLLKKLTIRAFIHKGETELTATTKQLVENIGRLDLDPIEEARQFKRLAELGMSQADIGRMAGGKGQSTIANTLKLLTLPAEVQKIIAEGGISAAHGQELVRFAAWPKACSFIAAAVAKNNARECDREDFINAKWLRDEELPFEHELGRAGYAVAIYVGSYSYNSRKQYKVSDELGKQPGFFKTGYEEWHYLLPADPKAPNLWEPERDKQDKAREVAKKAAATGEARAQSKMTPAEKAKRAKVIAENKQARLESALGHGAVLQHIKGMDGFELSALAVIAQRAFESHWKVGRSDRLKSVAAKLSIILPPKLTSNKSYGVTGIDLKLLAKMKPLDVFRLTAGCICDLDSETSVQGAGPICDTVELVLGAKATAALKKKAADQLAATKTKKS